MTKQEALQELMDLSIDYGTRTAEEIERLDEAVDMAIAALRADAVDRQSVIDSLRDWADHSNVEVLPAVQPLVIHCTDCEDWLERQSILGFTISELPAAQPEQRYTEEELRVFAHGISLSLLSKRSAQHWRYDKDTATEIEFLERLYDKVSADMKGEQ